MTELIVSVIVTTHTHDSSKPEAEVTAARSLSRRIRLLLYSGSLCIGWISNCAMKSRWGCYLRVLKQVLLVGSRDVSWPVDSRFRNTVPKV